MSADHLVCVDPAHVSEVLPHVQPLLESAYATESGERADEGLDDLIADLSAGRQLLWVMWDGMRIFAAATNRLIETRRGRICVLTCGAGSELHRWRHHIETIEQYARERNCVAVRLHGRKGWKRAFPDYIEPWITLEKDMI